MTSTLAAAWNSEAGRPPRRDLAIDAAVALLAFAVGVMLVYSGGLGPPAPGTREGDALGVLLTALVTLPLAARRVAPAVSLGLSTGAAIPLLLLHYPGELMNAPLLALYSLAAAAGRDRRPTKAAATFAAGAFLAVATSVAVMGAGTDGFPAPELLGAGLLWLAVWIAGDRGRLRRERMSELEERAVRAEREAERERRLAAAEERAKIARELHDSAGHAMNVILVEAGAARLLRERDPARSRAALDTIEEVARGTLEEIDRLVRALRDDGATPADLAPSPGLDALNELVERHRAAGLAVTARVDGQTRKLPPEVDRAAYRIVQEALTNAARHGRGSADVALHFEARAVEISVANPLPPDAAPRNGGGGHGIVGMRERAQLLGGSLQARPEGGAFRVRAHLPYGGEAP